MANETYCKFLRNIPNWTPAHPVTGWAWDFDSDGSIDSEEASPEWTYVGADTYSVALTVTNRSFIRDKSAGRLH